MINELIEKEIEKLEEGCACGSVTRHFRDSLQTIAKEVAMRFREEVHKRVSCVDCGVLVDDAEVDIIADQIINEVSK